MTDHSSSAGPTGVDESSALDPAIIKAYVIDACGGDLELVLQMVDFFVNSAEKLVAEMHSSLASGDREVLRRAAHSLKSSSRMFSAYNLSDLSATVEKRAKEADTDGVADLLGQMEGELARLTQALPAFCRTILA